MNTAIARWLDLDVPERVVFARSPLALALCQIKFAPILKVSSPSVVAGFQEAIIERYPLAAQSQQQNFHLQVEGRPEGGQASIQSNLSSMSWRFGDVEDTWTVVLAPDFLALETRAYRDFSDFENRLIELLQALDEFVHPTVGARIGLRYVNEVRSPDDAWRIAIRPELLGVLAVPRFGETVVHSVQQLVLRLPGDVQINMQYGLIPTGSVVSPRPGDVAHEESFYLLDIDVFQEYKPGELSMEPEFIIDRVRMYHEIISKLFRWSITDAYRSMLQEA